MDPALLITIRLFIALIMLVGAVTLVFPVLTGLVIIWAGAIIYGLAVGFTTPGWVILTIITVLMIVGFILDYVVMGATLKQGGASWSAVILAMISGIIATFALPPFGGLVFAPLVLFIVEWIRLKQWRLALLTTRSYIFGITKTTLTRMGFGLTMIILWFFWVFYY